MMNKKKWLGLAVIILFAAALVAAGVLRWKHAQVFPSTEDAYVAGDIVPVAPRIAGTLLTLPVEENQLVHEGDVVATLDPRDMDATVAKAKAGLATARSVLAADRANIAQAEAALEGARSDLELKRLDRERFTKLAERDSIPTRLRDQAVTAAEVAEARVKAAEKRLAAARAALGVTLKRVEAARVLLAQARLDRSYCTVTAPATGRVSRKTAQVGQVVAPGQPLFTIVPLEPDRVWVRANFKETQLRRIRPGQPVRLHTDVDPGRIYHGHVESLSAGTGAAFSLLPPENATGNWVKIVQRLPVRIAIDPGDNADHSLRLGLSVHVTVDTTTGGVPGGPSVATTEGKERGAQPAEATTPRGGGKGPMPAGTRPAPASGTPTTPPAERRAPDGAVEGP
ncbi:MAG: HlyD family efflux transporter periplasmic adaptor subunit [Acidobacteria bacterium]|nr:HlyD family efflux transporter periplasmic adaptor subunit [Acidobacteriota bacterium]